MKAIFAALCAVAVSGCMTSGPRPEQLALQATINQGYKDCADKLPFGMARAKCLNGVVERYVRPTYPFPDLVNVIEATRIAVAEKYEKKEITEAEAKLQLAKSFSDEQAEYTRRLNQQAALQMQRDQLILSSMPVTCTTLGITTNCF